MTKSKLNPKYFDTMGNDVSDAYPTIEDGGAPNIMSAACDVLKAAHDMTRIISTLRAVNTDRMADQLASLQISLTRSGECIQAWTTDWQRREHDHNGAIMGGLLGVVLKHGDAIMKNNETLGGVDATAETD